MDPTNQTFQELLSNGVKYIVPRFQRDYAWDQEQWEDLWADIDTLQHYHYMGYIVLLKKEPHKFEVIDGQQRLVTLSLIVLAAMANILNLINQGIEKTENQERLRVLTDRLIGYKNLVTMNVNSKLYLNRNNNYFYQKICSNLAPLNPVGITASNQLIKQAFEFFRKPMFSLSGSELGELIENISSKMLFTKIVVRDSLDAYKLFETLNARGVQLSTPDLLKNYLFSIITSNDEVPDEQINELDEDWLNILTQLRENNFSDFIRHQHNIQNDDNSKRNLFRSLKQIANTPQLASQYLRSLTEYAPVYASLLNPHDEWWKTHGNAHHKISYYLQGLKLFAINQPFPVLMVACQNFSSEEFLKTLKYLFVLSVRYNIICRFSPAEQERAYNKIAMKVFNGEHTRASHIKNSDEFKQLYPDDKAFQNAFEFYKMPSRRFSKKIRFLLTEIENSFGRELNYLDTTLEHVCPYNPDQAWYENFGEGVNDIADRLGNMVLLEKDELRRANFQTKKEVYLSTSFRLAKKVAEYDNWDLATLSHYQIWLAKQAVKTWRIE
ncbi:MAG: DUF262 domain-containing HNH endonuclease family protein [Pseudomonadota bacterium]